MPQRPDHSRDYRSDRDDADRGLGGAFERGPDAWEYQQGYREYDARGAYGASGGQPSHGPWGPDDRGTFSERGYGGQQSSYGGGRGGAEHRRPGFYGEGYYSGREASPPEVRGNFAGRGPKGYRRSDERIAEDVCERLTMHPDVDASEIEVKVAEGEVTLAGSIDSRPIKRLAEEIAEEVAGVRDVHNQLRIKGRERGWLGEQNPQSEQNRRDDTGRQSLEVERSPRAKPS